MTFRRKNKNKAKRKDPNTPKQDDRDKVENSYSPIQKNNELFENYYKEQQIITDDNEWNQMLDSLRTILPTTFRFTGARSHAAELKESMKHEFFEYMKDLEIEGESIEVPKPLPWYPDELGWHFNCSRSMVKKSKELKRFHNFLVSETEIGNISRQEAVSMIPPMLLDVNPNHWVLDMCAAPGSKTAQIIEAVHNKTSEIPTGLVIANDVDHRRAYMLAHQARRLQSSSMLICNHDATLFPKVMCTNLEDPTGPAIQALFDRVLCDVPCSGDGTMRKNQLIWRDWSPASGLSLHLTQLRILIRGAQLLKVGGRVVYSTCSLNPVENEAVVAEMLQKCNGALKLVDVSDELPELKRRPGLDTWKVMLKDNKIYDKYEDIPEDKKKDTPESLFPPRDTKSLGLDRCLRIYPHLQDTGGFFVAVFEKVLPITKADRDAIKRADGTWVYEQIDNDNVGDMKKRERSPSVEASENAIDGAKRQKGDSPSDESENLDEPSTGMAAEVTTERVEKRAPVRGPQEDPFFILDADHKDVLSIGDFYGLKPEFPRDQFVVRTETDEPRNISFVSAGVKSIMTANAPDKFKIVVCGVKMFVRQSTSAIATVGEENETDICPLRIQSEGLATIMPYLSDKRKLLLTLEDLKHLLKHEYPLLAGFSESLQQKIQSIGRGCTLFEYDPTDGPNSNLHARIIFPVWRAPNSLNMLLNKQEKRSLAHRVFGTEPADVDGSVEEIEKPSEE